MVPRAQQQQMPWFERSQHDKQNKPPSFTDRFNPWNVKFGLRNPDLILPFTMARNNLRNTVFRIFTMVTV
jgi:hypothetical protein